MLPTFDQDNTVVKEENIETFQSRQEKCWILIRNKNAKHYKIKIKIKIKLKLQNKKLIYFIILNSKNKIINKIINKL